MYEGILLGSILVLLGVCAMGMGFYVIFNCIA